MSAIIKSSNPILSTYIRNQWLTALTTNPARVLWATPLMHLSHDPAFAPTQASTNATLSPQEATFSGYAATAPVIVVPVNLDQAAQGAIASTVFEATSPFSIADQITGYWGSDAGGNMIVAEATNVGNPIAVQAAQDYVQVDLQLPIQYRQAV